MASEETRTAPSGRTVRKRGTDGRSAPSSASSGSRASPSKQGTTKPTASRQTASKPTASKPTSAKQDTSKQGSGQGTSADAGSAKPSSKSSSKPSSTKRGAAAVVAKVREDFPLLTGTEVESVSGVSKGEDGWTVWVEVVETRKIPDTADIMAQYEVTTDADGDLEGYMRQARYIRGRPSR